MLYIKFTKDYFEEFQKQYDLPKFMIRMIYSWEIIRGKFFKKNIDNGELIVFTKLNKKTKKNLLKYLELFNMKKVCLSEELSASELRNDLENLGITILDGKWLYKYLINNIVEYIAMKKQVDVANQEISILVNQLDDIDFENIMILSEKCRNVNVITSDPRKLKKLEEYLYNEKGIVLNITQNYAKSLIKSDVIINMDFEEAELNKYNFPRKAIVVSLKNNAKVLFKGFDGINIFSYKITIPKKYVNPELNLESFNKEVLYESFIYRKTNPKNVIEKIKEDNVKISCLVGINGEIRENEYLRLQVTKKS